MRMGFRKGPILTISQTNHPHKSPVNFREVQLSSVGSDDCRQGFCAFLQPTLRPQLSVLNVHFGLKRAQACALRLRLGFNPFEGG